MSTALQLPIFAVTLIRDWIDREMADISEEHYAASWMVDLPHSIWRAVQSLPYDYSYGMGCIGVDRLQRLKQASDLIGEWHNGEAAVTIEHWKREYDSAKAVGKVIS